MNMKEEIRSEAYKSYPNTGHPIADSNASEKITGFIDGAEWMLSKYNGISPDTVKEMYEALNTIRKNYDNVEDLAGKIAREAYDKANKELGK